MRHRGRVRTSFSALLVFALAASGCSDNDGEPLGDGPGPSEAGPDVEQPDAGIDSTADAPPDRIEIAGLDGEVSAVYDSDGVLHLTCKSDGDCMAALGYFHADNRFFQMDFARRYVRGQLGGLVMGGALVLDNDYTMRHFMTDASGTPLEELGLQATSPETLALIERYTAGVNAWLADLEQGRNGAKLADEYDFPLIAKENMRAWEPEDTMAVAMFMVYDLGSTTDSELQAGDIAASFEPDLAADLLSVRPAFQVSTAGSSGLTTIDYKPHPKLDLSRFAAAKSVLRQARSKLDRLIPRTTSGAASNNWVVAPGLTKDGKALLCNDPHLATANPSFFMPVELDSVSQGDGTLHVAGGTIAGIPVMAIGRNEHIAWGVTTINWDLNEVYIETLNDDGTAVIFEGQEVPLLEKTFTFEDATGDPVEKTFRWVPHHGPLIAEDLDAKQAISVRWSPQEGLSDADAFMNLMRAESVAELPEALAPLVGIDQNFIAVDLEGNIGWFPYAKIPSRPWASMALPPWLPVPGDGSAEWDGFVPLADLPQAINPENGFIATANQATTDATMDGDPTNDDKASLTYQAWYKSTGDRMSRIVQLLTARSDHTVETMLATQSDVHSLVGEAIAPDLLAAVAGATLDPDATNVVDALTAWQYTCPTGLATTDPKGDLSADAAQVSESVGCTAFHVVLYHLVGEALGDEIKASGMEALSMHAQMNLLLTSFIEPTAIKSSFWDDVETAEVETRDDIVLEAIIAAGATLAGYGPVDQWQWGRIHNMSLLSPFSEIGGIAIFNEGPYANDGALGTVDVAAPNVLRGDRGDMREEKMDLNQVAGAALRMVIEASSEGMVMKFQLPGGTSLDRDSPRYNQLIDRYLVNEPFDFAFGPGAVTDPAEELTVNPAAE